MRHAFSTLLFCIAASAAAIDDVATRVSALLASSRPAEALRLLHAQPDRFDPFDRHMLTGRACLALGRFDAALKAFDQAASLRPQSPDAHFQVALASVARNDAARAVLAFERAADAGMDNADFHAAWARCLLTLNRPLGNLAESACPAKADSGDLLPDGRVVVRRLDRLPPRCVAAGRDGAIFHASRAARLADGNGEHLLLMADVWLAAGRRDAASKAFARAAEKLPPAVRGPCYERWSECLLASRDYEAYFARLRDWMALPGGITPPRLADAYARVAAAMRDGGDVPRQISYLTFAVELDPAACDRRLALGDALAGAGRIVEAAEQWRSALRLCPKHARSADLRRWLADIDRKQ